MYSTCIFFIHKVAVKHLDTPTHDSEWVRVSKPLTSTAHTTFVHEETQWMRIIKHRMRASALETKDFLPVHRCCDPSHNHFQLTDSILSNYSFKLYYCEKQNDIYIRFPSLKGSEAAVTHIPYLPAVLSL